MLTKRGAIPLISIPALILILLLTLLTFSTRQTSGNTGIWQDVAESQLRGNVGNRVIIPDAYRTLQADTALLQSELATAPLEIIGSNQVNGLELVLPLPNGEYGRFSITESPIMAPELAAKFPTIKTYAGQGLDDPTATARLDWTPQGFHAMIISASGTIYIDPYSQGNTTTYISYNKSDNPPPQDFEELPAFDPDNTAEELAQQVNSAQGGFSSGAQLRIYRLAVAATGEYTQFHGGTVQAGQAAIVTAVNRVNGIYDREAAVRFTLVANNDTIVFTNGANDPYSNNNGFNMLDQNQDTLDSRIGSGNYDVGHVFSTGGGGVAGLGVICNGNRKAEGVTGLGSPTGDTFYVDFVAHELGHQFAATHTFNGTQSSCSGGNRSSISAYEPGSGTTIMGYAGICGSDDTQDHSDDYFHTINFDQIQNHITAGSGSSCGTIVSTGNSAPVANAGSGGFTIPVNTPFELTGAGSDAESDSLTYNWEQFDLGPGGAPDSPVGNAPLFRSFSASTSPTRTFPQLSDILTNSATYGEILPSYARSLVFRLTVRDNNVGGGGVAHDQMSISVTDSAGPFAVTAPNTAVSYAFGDTETISWNVANTANAPVSCANVDILLSLDGGQTFPLTLLAATPNDGSELINVPNASLSDARLKIACSDNIFFDISNSDFEITTASVQAPTAVSISGNTTGFGLVEYTFTADATPTDAIIPITYEWTVTDNTGVTSLNLYSDTATFSWTSIGTKTIDVTATNSAGNVSSTTFDFEVGGSIVYLPLAQTTP